MQRYLLLVTLGIFMLISSCSDRESSTNRVVQSLNGTWEIADSEVEDHIPHQFGRSVDVPGLVHNAEPAFENVDAYLSESLIFKEMNNPTKIGLPDSVLRENGKGVSLQQRNYFWYRTTFTPSAKRTHAYLQIKKAQFGTTVWLNSTRIGEDLHCFTAQSYNLSEDIKWDNENVLIVRVGAHPGVLPDSIFSGLDFEKTRWTPGIYDDIELILTGNPMIKYLQIAPDIRKDEVTVQFDLVNHSEKEILTDLFFSINDDQNKRVANSKLKTIRLKAGEEKQIEHILHIPDPKYWTPESPHLYQLNVKSSGDQIIEQFGMRELRFDGQTGMAYLNDQPYYLRGTNITLHRFFEDPQSKKLPWDTAWVKKMLIDIPKELGWNSMRFCIGPVPEFWFDMADEYGLMIQNEFPYWQQGSFYRHRGFVGDTADFKLQVAKFMRDHWNHPSVVIWDIANETTAPELTDIINRVRNLDISDRPWENSYNPPVRPTDPVEEHPYKMHYGFKSWVGDQPYFTLDQLVGMKRPQVLDRSKQKQMTRNYPVIINEYGWIWVNRDGTTTVLTDEIYDYWLGDNATADQRFKFWNYHLAAMTEKYRSLRAFAGLHHFVYLTNNNTQSPYPMFTSDHFTDVASLQLEDHFKDYVKHAFQPLGVYIDYFEKEPLQNDSAGFDVQIINDHQQIQKGTLHVWLENDEGEAGDHNEIPFEVEAMGKEVYNTTVVYNVPPGVYTLNAEAKLEGEENGTLSRRFINIQPRIK